MTAPLTSLPRADGFRLPGEFEPHAGTWLLWPERPDVWRAQAGPAQQAFTTVAEAIARFEPVTVGVSAAQFARARRALSPAIQVIPLPYNDAWMRDNGPTFVVSAAGQVRGVDWRFNAWGGLYADFTQDEATAPAVLEHVGAARYAADFVLEGGAIHVDGQGTLLTTEQCLLNPNRNPQLSRAALEQRLGDYLNVEHILWLGAGITGDETGGHVDDLCCFVRPGVVALHWTDDRGDPDYLVVREAEARLRAAVDARGRRLEVARLVKPPALFATDEESAALEARPDSLPRPAGHRLAATYINYYVANGGVIAPVFGCATDAPALAALQSLYPDRKVVGVPGREIVLGGGCVHCITQPQPAGVPGG